MNKKLSDDELAIRKQHVEEAINSVELEGLSVSSEQRNNFEKFAQGLISLEELDQLTKGMYGSKN